MFAPRENCQITFDKYDRTFYPDQVVSGRIKLDFHVQTALRGIYYKVNGKAYCNWIQGSGLNSPNYIGRHTVIDQKVYLVGDRNSEQQFKFEPGEYSYNFSATLPTHIPISFDGQYGYVRYKIMVGIDRRLNRHHYEETFIVIKDIDLNHFPYLKNRVEIDQSVKFSTFYLNCIPCLPSAPLTITARLAHSGFVPGQEILIDINVDNQSGQTVKSVETALVKIITCRTKEMHKSPHILETKSVAISESLGCSPFSLQVYRIGVLIPEGLPPTETGSYCCRLEYEIRITGKVSLWHENLILKVPILIGTVPIDIDNYSDESTSEA